MRFSILALSLTLGPVLAFGPGYDFGRSTECKTPPVADCLRLIDLISDPHWKDLSFPVHVENFSPIAYYGDCALAAVHIDSVEGEMLTQSFGEAAGIAHDIVDAGLKEGGEMPIAHDVKLHRRGLFLLSLTVSAGDLEAWEEIVDDCMKELMQGKGRVRPSQGEQSVFPPDSGDRSHFEQQPVPDRLPNCGLAGIPSIDGSRYGCNAQPAPGPLVDQTNPFTMLIGRCPGKKYWQCRSGFVMTVCYCSGSKEAEHIIEPHNSNVTKFDVQAQLASGNNETAIDLFTLKCSKNEVASCRRILPRPFVCGCYLELQSDDSGERPCHGDQAHRTEPEIAQVSNSTELQFQLVQWPICTASQHFKCCKKGGSTICYCGKGTKCK
ncbi:hypothetical protein GP486_007738 [Trichoglossum hirsutum]|uniref:Uncharacterized protein n=1 Tax=Trichoglossum hirsutum TaxID=265104 RepID=A0A9P8L4N3_9PEZI|nr:hypothetical protein GP486_007738 [Trichoglossum hirsutum]